MQNVTYNSATDMVPAYAGLPADSMFTDKVSVPSGAAGAAFGALVGVVPATGISVLPVGTLPLGIAIHDHNYGGIFGGQNGYVQYDSISVMKRGRIWALASGTCTKGAVAKYDPATGIFADAGTGTLANARFITSNLSIVGIASGDAAQIIVQVELHDATV